MKDNVEKLYGYGDLPTNYQDPMNYSSTKFVDELVDAKEITDALSIGNTKWWEGVRAGIYPAPVHLGTRCTRWRKSEINHLIIHGV